MDLQRIDTYALIEAPRNAKLDSLLAIFGRWRNDAKHPAKWVDLADYAHMSRGAGIVIVGKQGIFGVTRFDPGLGLFYSGRSEYEGSCEQRVIESFRRHLSLATALLSEPDYPDELKRLTGVWNVTINDRLNFPNNEETDQQLRPAIQAALDSLLGSGSYELTPITDRKQRYGFTFQTNTTNLNQLLETAEKALS